MTQSAAMFVVGVFVAASGIALWLLQRSEQRRERERQAQTPFDPAAGHKQTQDLRRGFGL